LFLDRTDSRKIVEPEYKNMEKEVITGICRTKNDLSLTVIP
jgi:hypothetical protein